MEESPEERREMLRKMRAASNQFYAAAINTGCHTFIEFTGLMNEFIKLCEDAEAQGIPWVRANVHGDHHLPFKPHHVEYLGDKIECIYGKRIKLVEDLPAPAPAVHRNDSSLGACFDCYGCDNCLPDIHDGAP